MTGDAETDNDSINGNGHNGAGSRVHEKSLPTGNEIKAYGGGGTSSEQDAPHAHMRDSGLARSAPIRRYATAERAKRQQLTANGLSKANAAIYGLGRTIVWRYFDG